MARVLLPPTVEAHTPVGTGPFDPCTAAQAGLLTSLQQHTAAAVPPVDNEDKLEAHPLKQLAIPCIPVGQSQDNSVPPVGGPPVGAKKQTCAPGASGPKIQLDKPVLPMKVVFAKQALTGSPSRFNPPVQALVQFQLSEHQILGYRLQACDLK